MLSLQGRAEVQNQAKNKYDFVNGLKLSFKNISEPESHIHPDINNNSLWENIPLDYTWLWNGLRGGLIIPAVEMEISGMSKPAYVSSWVSKGADENKIKGQQYFAYSLQGFYSFSDKKNYQDEINKLRSKVKFLVEDAPALEGSINPNAPVQITDLVNGYNSASGKAISIQPLVNSGRNLIQAPVVAIEFGQGKGKLILSQMITHGRLVGSQDKNELYNIRYDVVACQMLINMIKTSVVEK